MIMTMTKLGEDGLVTGKLRSELAHSLPLEAWVQDKELVLFEPFMGNLEEAARAMGRAVLSLSQFSFLLSHADL